MKLPLLLNALYNEPALITPDSHRSITRIIEERLFNRVSVVGPVPSPGDISAAGPVQIREPGVGVCGETVEVEGMEIDELGVAHIPIGGVLGQNLAPFQRGEGAVDVIEVMDELKQAAADDSVRGAVLLMDSPGGMYQGVPECAAAIAGFDKPIFTFCRGLMGSGGYYLAAATDGIFCTQTAIVGGIGAYLARLDATRAFAMAGYKMEMFSSGKFKGMGYPGTALTPEQKAHLQASVDQINALFAAHVRATRGEGITDDTMEGQTFYAPEALERGLIDALVEALDEVLALF